MMPGLVLTRRSFVTRSAALVLGAQAPPRLPPKPLRALRAAVRGHVYVPGSHGYDAARVVFNRRYDGVRPPAVVRVRDAADVVAALRWADRFDVPLVARSGGHGYSGNSTSRHAVVIDLGALDRVRLRDGIATVGPGARLGHVYAALARHGATVPAGSCPTVAIGGLVLAGGMGLAGRDLGLTLDRVTSFDAVTADGVRRRVDDGDLFWALRGGGGGLAIVTAVRLRVHRVRRAAWFRVSFGRDAREEALAEWDALAPHAPRALTAILTLTESGGAAFGQHMGREAALRRLVAPLARLGTVRTGAEDYLALQRRWAGPPARRSTFAASSLYVGHRLSARGRRAFVDAADTGAGLILDAYGGAVNAVPRGATAFAHRDARFSVQVLSYTAVPVARSRVRRARALIAPFGHGAYPGYADPDLAHARRAYYGANLERLDRVKAAVDPAGRLR